MENNMELNEQNAQEVLEKLRKDKFLRKNHYLSDFFSGEKLADKIAATVGSWRFIIVQSIILIFWIFLNVTAYVNKWDPYPFILLNLFLSFQAAYAAPIIMMSQNRENDLDRKKAEDDYRINIKAELEIELLHNKVDSVNQQLVEIREILKEKNLLKSETNY
ncbi:MAG: DUF1003 domain-containing protein [Candidatus Gastranaerophilaceae bacterium]|jgi:uncharacterized membrane protein